MAKAEEGKEAHTPENNVLTVRIEDSGKEVGIWKGDILQIELKTFGTAGYTWQFDDLDPDYLEIISKETKPVSDRMGGPRPFVYGASKPKRAAPQESP